MSIFPYSSHQRTYVRATKTGQHQLAVRTKSPKGQWPAGVLLFAGLDHKDILTLMGLPRLTDETSIILAYAHFYDQRGGACRYLSSPLLLSIISWETDSLN